MKPPHIPRLDVQASAADRWTTCTASPAYVLDNQDKLPPRGTKFSTEGTTAAEVAAALLEGREVDPKACESPVDAEMRMHAFRYSEYVLDHLAPGGHLLVEKKLPLWYAEGRNSYCDAAAVNKDSLHVFEYKYGEGMAVYPEGNLQLSIYAYAIALQLRYMLPPEHPVYIHVCQPRCAATGESQVWATTFGEIMAICAEVTKKASTALKREGVFAPSDKACQWCPAKGFCDARKAKALPALAPVGVQPSLRPGAFPPAATLSHEQIAMVVRYGPEIKKWINDVCDYAQDTAIMGPKNPYLRLKMGRPGNRFWQDEAGAEGLLRTMVKNIPEIYEPSVLKGPAPIEKIVGEKVFADKLARFVGRPPGSPKVEFDETKEIKA